MSNLLKAALLSGLVLGIAASCSRAVDRNAIDKAIEAGVKALRDMQGADGAWPPHREFGATASTTTGATALAGLTLLECGAKPDDNAVLRAAEVVRKASINLTYNYSICLAILFFDRLGDPDDIPLIESLTVRLLAGQTSTGGWNYQCPFIPDEEVRRLQAQLAGRKELAGRGQPPKPGGVKRAAKDLPREIQQQLALLHRQSGTMMEMGSDNSNTQFATLALWVAHRYGLPVENALKRVETRFRTTQRSDGGWGYFDPSMRASGPMGRSTASMTCAGLLGLAVANGQTAETARERKPGGKPARDLNKDSHIRRGLLSLSTAIGTPVEQREGRQARQAPSMPRTGGRTYYFLWSLERVAVALDLKTIGKKDWYTWGAEILLANQQADGSWQGSYADCGADTCFALLFLKRANLVADLTTQLTGRVHDPGERVLKSSALREGVALEKTGDLASGIEGKTTKPSEDGRYPDGLAKSKEPRPAPKPVTEPKAPDKPPAERTTADNAAPSATASMAKDLATSTGSRFNLLLHNMKIGKGGEFTEALALAIPKIKGERQQKVREALVERLTRMKDTTLSEYLGDEQVELRIAAARAAAAKGIKTLIPRLIPLVRDTKGGMSEAAHQALKQLSGQDFGPKPGASRDERVQAARQWLDWWNKQGK